MVQSRYTLWNIYLQTWKPWSLPKAYIWGQKPLSEPSFHVSFIALGIQISFTYSGYIMIRSPISIVLSGYLKILNPLCLESNLIKACTILINLCLLVGGCSRLTLTTYKEDPVNCTTAPFAPMIDGVALIPITYTTAAFGLVGVIIMKQFPEWGLASLGTASLSGVFGIYTFRSSAYGWTETAKCRREQRKRREQDWRYWDLHRQKKTRPFWDRFYARTFLGLRPLFFWVIIDLRSDVARYQSLAAGIVVQWYVQHWRDSLWHYRRHWVV